MVSYRSRKLKYGVSGIPWGSLLVSLQTDE